MGEYMPRRYKSWLDDDAPIVDWRLFCFAITYFMRCGTGRIPMLRHVKEAPNDRNQTAH